LPPCRNYCTVFEKAFLSAYRHLLMAYFVRDRWVLVFSIRCVLYVKLAVHRQECAEPRRNHLMLTKHTNDFRSFTNENSIIMKIVIVGGVAGGASCAARARRLNEQAEIVVLQRDNDVSYASCGR